MSKYKPVPISLTTDLLELAEARADALGLSRSGYIQQLIRADNGMNHMLGTAEPTQKPTRRSAAKGK